MDICLSTFFNGFTTAYFTIYGYHILKDKGKTRIMRLLGYIFIVWALFNFKDLYLAFPGNYTPTALRYIFLIDGISGLTFTVFLMEITIPGWLTVKRFLLCAIPFVIFLIWGSLAMSDTLCVAYVVFLLIYGNVFLIKSYCCPVKHFRVYKK